MIQVFLRRKYRDPLQPFRALYLSPIRSPSGCRLAQALTRAAAHMMVNADNSILPLTYAHNGRCPMQPPKGEILGSGLRRGSTSRRGLFLDRLRRGCLLEGIDPVRLIALSRERHGLRKLAADALVTHAALDQRSQKKPRDTQRGRVQGKAS